MRKLSILTALILLLASCKFYEPEFRGGEQFTLDKVDGQTVAFNASAKVYNGNWFGIKVKPSNFDLYIDGDHIGKISLDKKVKMKRKQETTLNAPFTATLDGKSMFELMKYAGRGDIKVRIKGKAKAGVFIFSKKIDIDETKNISGSSLNFGR